MLCAYGAVGKAFIPRRCTSVYNGGSSWGEKEFKKSIAFYSLLC